MAPRRRPRLEIATLAAALSLPGVSSAAAEPSELDLFQERYTEGRELYDRGDFAGAAEAWADLLPQIPEVEANRLTRQALLLAVLMARIDAYRQTSDPEEAVLHLQVAQRVAVEYWSAYREAYGEDVSDPAVAERSDEVDQLLEQAERRLVEPGDDGELLVCLQPCLDPLPPPGSRRGCGKDDPDGSGVTMLGVLGLPLLLRRRRRRDALEAVAARLPADVVARLRDRDDDEAG